MEIEGCKKSSCKWYAKPDKKDTDQTRLLICHKLFCRLQHDVYSVDWLLDQITLDVMPLKHKFLADLKNKLSTAFPCPDNNLPLLLILERLQHIFISKRFVF
jgi:hypothetical protein